VGGQHCHPLGTWFGSTGEGQDVANGDTLPLGSADELGAERRQLRFAHKVRDALECLRDLYCRQLAQRGVVELKAALDLTVDQQAPVAGAKARVTARVLGDDVEVAIAGDRRRELTRRTP